MGWREDTDYMMNLRYAKDQEREEKNWKKPLTWRSMGIACSKCWWEAMGGCLVPDHRYWKEYVDED